MTPDFGGYATKNGLKCSDGLTIMSGAFKHNSGMKVPLVWQHQYDAPANILGYATLEHRDDGVYALGFFNDTEQGQTAKRLVKHGDVTALSIYANRLSKQGDNVVHGDIKEVSLVMAGANPGAFIDKVYVQHGEDLNPVDDEVIIYTGLSLQHADDSKDESETKTEGEDRPISEVLDTLNEEQKNVVYYLLSEATGGDSDDSDKSDDDKSDDKKDAQHSDTDDDKSGDDDTISHQEDSPMSRNLFENDKKDTQKGATLTHSQLKTIMEDAQKMGSYKESFLKHAVEYGIENIDLMFPDAKAITNAPEFVSRRMEWVAGVLSGTRHTPFSRIKSLSADITHDEARAKGYIKATLKKEEFFAIAKRVTTPTTVYKKQKLDRDDIIDITELDVVAWLKAEMRVMLDEELARAVLVGDGREVDDEDKIPEVNIRPIAKDDDFYAHRVQIPTNVTGDALVEAILRARPHYRGSGNPTMYVLEETLTDLLLVKDKMGRRLYPTQAELESALRVSKIVPVPVMEGQTTDQGDLMAIIVNLSDYTIGADKGGNVSMFDDFDIDYNQYKYLIETRASGALTKYKSALVISRAAGTSVTPTAPTFDAGTGVVTIPAVTGVVYRNQDTGEALTSGAQNAIAIGATLSVEADPAEGYYFPGNIDTDWDFTRTGA